MMNTQQLNFAMADVLRKWDPFQSGYEFYEPEIADVLLAVRDLEDRTKLAEKIQSIYEHSFETNPNFDECLKIADQLLMIKNEASCSF
jgi:hypothetical protein